MFDLAHTGHAPCARTTPAVHRPESARAVSSLAYHAAALGPALHRRLHAPTRTRVSAWPPVAHCHHVLLPRDSAARCRHTLSPHGAATRCRRAVPSHATSAAFCGSASGGCRSGGHRRNGVHPFPLPAAGRTLPTHAIAARCRHLLPPHAAAARCRQMLPPRAVAARYRATRCRRRLSWSRLRWVQVRGPPSQRRPTFPTPRR